jgi:hypothetical protein
MDHVTGGLDARTDEGRCRRQRMTRQHLGHHLGGTHTVLHCHQQCLISDMWPDLGKNRGQGRGLGGDQYRVTIRKNRRIIAGGHLYRRLFTE